MKRLQDKVAVITGSGAGMGEGIARLEVTELLMTAYMSAEQERTIEWKPKDLDAFIPAVARGIWKG